MADDAQKTTEKAPAGDAAPDPQPNPPSIPATPTTATPTTATPTTGTAPAGDAGDGDGKLDPQLIGMALVLWLLAMAIFAFKWDRLRVDWYLGNIKETGDLSKRLDEPSIEALAALAQDDPEVVRMVGDEVVGPLANADPFYRMAIVRTLEQVDGPTALELLTTAATTDVHAVVRANAYRSLGARAKEHADERAHVTSVIVGVLAGEPEPMARAYALDVAAELGAREALWPVIRAVRDARGKAPAIDREAAEAGEKTLREKGAAAFYALSGASEEQLPFDAAADLATRDAQVRAWEAWYVKQGGVIPANEAFDQVYPSTTTSPPGPSPQGSPSESESESEAQGQPQ